MAKKRQHRKSQWVRGVLCGIFAASAAVPAGLALLGPSEDSSSLNNAPCVTVDSAGTAPASDTDVFFGTDAQPLPQDQSPYLGELQETFARQQALLQQPRDSADYIDFMAAFDRYRDECLAKMAVDVNQMVTGYVTYTSDEKVYNSPEYWAAPVETVMNQKGDCEDYAILQYAALRHLGVPEDRLSFGLVRSDPKDKGPDHAVLLLNIAPADRAADYVVLNDGGPVVRDDSYTKDKNVPGWPHKYTFYYAFNNDKSWVATQADTAAVSRPAQPQITVHRLG